MSLVRDGALLPATAGRALIRARYRDAVDESDPSRRRSVRVFGAALSSCLPAYLIVLGAGVLSVLRGLLYGVVDRGPYDNSWGGPSRAGAWAAHVGVAVGIVLCCVALFAGLGLLQRRWAVLVEGRRPALWAIVVTAVVAVVSVFVIVGWLRQI